MAIDWVAEEAFVDLPALSPHVRRVIPLAAAAGGGARARGGDLARARRVPP